MFYYFQSSANALDGAVNAGQKLSQLLAYLLSMPVTITGIYDIFTLVDEAGS